MTQPVDEERTALQTLATALAYAQGFDAVASALRAFPGISAEGVRLLARIPQVRALARLNPQPGAHAAVQAVHRTNLMRRAAYLGQAARRMSTAATGDPRTMGVAIATEQRYLLQHLQAMSQREVAATAVASQARRQAREAKREGSTWNGLVGWYAVNDAHTSAECKAANGCNFDPTSVPPIGFPGAVHANCRCKPGPPHNTDRRVERVRSEYNPGKSQAPRRVFLKT
jgi:hypothetical protein